jgi:transglutaminase-like putative cysteine protease
VKPGGGFEIELEGEIAAIVELAQGTECKKIALEAAVREAFRGSAKMVEGPQLPLFALARRRGDCEAASRRR